MLARLGLLSAILSWGAYRLSLSAVGVVCDTRPAGAALTIVAIGLAVPAMRRPRHGLPSAGRRVVGGAALLLAILAGILIARDRFFTYRSEKVRFLNGDVTLAGTLFLPRGADAPCPAVIILHGSGEETRDEGEFYARLFAHNGIAGLAYGKRGNGASGGDLVTATYEDLAADALAAVRYLEGRPEVDDGSIGLTGKLRGVAAGGVPRRARHPPTRVVGSIPS